jgi:hypothetical protein
MGGAVYGKTDTNRRVHDGDVPSPESIVPSVVEPPDFYAAPAPALL